MSNCQPRATDFRATTAAIDGSYARDHADRTQADPVFAKVLDCGVSGLRKARICGRELILACMSRLPSERALTIRNARRSGPGRKTNDTPSGD